MVILPGLLMYDGRGRRIFTPAQKVHRGMISEWSDAIVAGFLALIAGIVWLVRLEHGTNKIKEIEDRLDDHIRNDDHAHNKMLDDLTTIRETTAEIKGYLSKNIH